MVVLGHSSRGRAPPYQWVGSGQPWHAPLSNGRGRGQSNHSWAGPEVDLASNAPVGNIDNGYFSVPHVSGAAIETRMTRHDRDGRTHPLAQRTPAVRGVATDRGVTGGDEAVVAGGVNVSGRATGPALNAGHAASTKVW